MTDQPASGEQPEQQAQPEQVPTAPQQEWSHGAAVPVLPAGPRTARTRYGQDG